MAPGTPHPELPARPPGSANLAGNRPVDISLDTLAREADWQDDSDVNIRQLFNTIFKRKWMILGIVFLGLAIGYINTLRTQPLYRANATIEIAKEAARILDQGMAEPQVIADAEFMATQSTLLRSRELAARTAESLSLTDRPEYADASLPDAHRLEAATNRILSRLRIVPEGRSRILRIEYISTDPLDAARVANALVENFIESSLERRYNTTAYARHFVEDRLIAARKALEEAESSLTEYAAREGFIELGNDTSIYALDGSTVISLNQQLADAQGQRIAAYEKFAQASANPSSIEIESSQELRRLRENRFNLQTEYENKLLIYRPEYPDVVKLRQQIELVDAEILAERDRIISGLESNYLAAREKEASLSQRIDELKAQLIDLRGRNVQYDILQRQVDTNRSQYEALLTRLKELTAAEGIGASQISIVDRATPPGNPYEPRLYRSLLLAGTIALLLGSGLAFLLNYLDDTIRVPEELADKLGLSILGIVPSAKGKADMITELLRDARNPLAEGFFSIRANLLFSTSAGVPRSIALTSNSPGEGKSTCCVGIALAFARSDYRVLIIDADMRRPSFATDNGTSVGLSGLLASNATLSSQIVSGEEENLFLLPAGRVPPNPAELLSSQKLFDILNESRQSFDLVIVDCPPVLGFADSPILANACDATVFVVQASRARRTAILRSLDRLKSTSARITGAILTKFDARKVGYDYDYYYTTYGPGAFDYAPSARGSRRRVREIGWFKTRGGDTRDPPADAG